jgi:hypothetical protein
VREDGSAHGVDAVGERVDLRECGEPPPQSGEREDGPGEEEHRQHEQLHDDLERLDLFVVIAVRGCSSAN